MKKINILIAVAIAAFVGACSTDSYETGDGELTYMVTEMVDMHLKGSTIQSITNDDDVQLKFSPTLKVDKSLERPDTTYRWMLTYTRKGDDPINVLGSDRVPVLEPVIEEKAYTAKKDPVLLQSVWRSRNSKYLNLYVGLVSGTATDKHRLDIVADSVTQLADGTSCHHISLRHDQNNIPQYYTYDAFVSVPLENYAKNDSVAVTIFTYEGKKALGCRVERKE